MNDNSHWVAKTLLSLSLKWKWNSLCPTLCNPMDSMEFSRPEYWSGLPCRPPGDLPKAGIKPRSPILQANSLPSEPQGKPFSKFQFSSVSQSCPTLCNPMNRSTPGLPVHHQLLEITQTHVYRVGDAIQPSHPLSLSLKAVKISSNINTPTQINLRNSSFSITKEGEISEYLTWVYWGNIIKQNLLPTQKISPQR